MEPRILNITGAIHPKAEIIAVDSAVGTVRFKWLTAGEVEVTSGESGALFTPVLPDEDGNYAEPSDAVLIAAIEAT